MDWARRGPSPSAHAWQQSPPASLAQRSPGSSRWRRLSACHPGTASPAGMTRSRRSGHRPPRACLPPARRGPQKRGTPRWAAPGGVPGSPRGDPGTASCRIQPVCLPRDTPPAPPAASTAVVLGPPLCAVWARPRLRPRQTLAKRGQPDVHEAPRQQVGAERSSCSMLLKRVAKRPLTWCWAMAFVSDRGRGPIPISRLILPCGGSNGGACGAPARNGGCNGGACGTPVCSGS